MTMDVEQTFKMKNYKERAAAEYKNLSKKFSSKIPDYNKQYCSVYLTRLKEMETLLTERITGKWGDIYPIRKLYKLAECTDGKYVVIGTLFKDQKLKPSILKQISEGNQLVPQPVLTHFTDESDVLFVEDELQRYQLIGGIDGKYLVTGISCAILGTDVGNGKLMVESYTFAGYRPQIERPLLEDSLYVILLSGLDYIHVEEKPLQMTLLADWISGHIKQTSRFDVSKIVRVIIAGNSIRSEKEIVKQQTTSMTSRSVESNETIEAVKILDNDLTQFCSVIDVDVMPGENDPSNHILPQKPMHHCMFPKCSSFKSFNMVTNPYICSVAGVRFLGTSGQPVTDIMRYSEVTDPLEALENCLKWNHMAPTAPDTLGCYPFYQSDPFIIDDCPHVMFAGNQKQFATKIVSGDDGQQVRLVSIPEFFNTSQAVVLDLKTLDCDTVQFKSNF